jgi:hypothetical protein
MNVTVKLQGALGRIEARRSREPVEFAMQDGATAGDLLARLAERFGRPFDATATGARAWLPRGVRMFVEGQMTRERDQPLAAPGAESQKVIVILVTPIMGGAR